MKPSATATIAAVALSLAAAAPASAEDLTSTQTAAILKQLKEIQEQLTGSKQTNNSKAISVLATAAASDKAALDLYLNCVKAVSFEKEQRRESEFRDWKNRNDDLHSSKEFRLILRMQLQYLVATIKAVEADEIAEAIPAAESFLDFYLQLDRLLAYPKDYKRGGGRLRDLAQSNVLDSPFAKHFKLDITAQPPAGWPAEPGDVEALCENILLPYYRKKKDGTSLAATWDKRIAHQTALAAAHREEESIGALNKIGEEILPRLEWAKARDIFQHINETTGAQSMLAVLRDNLSHPDATMWLEEITALLNGDPLPGSEEDEAVAGDTPPATPEPSEEERAKTIRDLLLDGES